MAHRKRVVVIGAGIVGVCAAAWIQRAGHDVVLVDRGVPGAATSFGNSGIFSTSGFVPINSPKLVLQLPGMLCDPASPLSLRWGYLPALAPWGLRFLRACTPGRVRAIVDGLARLAQEAEGGFFPLVRSAGAEHLLAGGGTLTVYASPKSYRTNAWARATREAYGVRSEELTGAEARELEPGLTGPFFRATWYKDVMHLRDPQGIVTAIADRFQLDGGQYLQAEVDRIQPLTPGGVDVVCAETTLPADEVVVAAGAWSKRLLAEFSERIPLDTERGYHVLFPEAGERLSRPVNPADAGFYITPMAFGLRVAGTVEMAGLDAPARPARTAALAAGARALLGDLGEPKSTWLGFRPTLPDSLPMIGRLPSAPNIICAFGHQHLGMTLGPVTGKLVAALVSEAEPRVDLAPYRPDRFS